MLASINWLKDYVDIDVTPEELADKFTGVGLEVERVIHLGAGRASTDFNRCSKCAAV